MSVRRFVYWLLLGVASWAVVAGLSAGVALLAGWPLPPAVGPVAFAVMVVALAVACSAAPGRRHR